VTSTFFGTKHRTGYRLPKYPAPRTAPGTGLKKSRTGHRTGHRSQEIPHRAPHRAPVSKNPAPGTAPSTGLKKSRTGHQIENFAPSTAPAEHNTNSAAGLYIIKKHAQYMYVDNQKKIKQKSTIC
jgi:hypothetical protein